MGEGTKHRKEEVISKAKDKKGAEARYEYGYKTDMSTYESMPDVYSFLIDKTCNLVPQISEASPGWAGGCDAAHDYRTEHGLPVAKQSPEQNKKSGPTK